MSGGYDWGAIKASAGIADVIGQVVPLKRKSGTLEGLCPFHNERSPSFKVYDDHYHCFGCGAHGDVIDFVMAIENVSHDEAIERVVGKDFKLDVKARAEITAKRAARDVAEREARERVMADCKRRWEAALPVPANHPYLARKGVEPHMARIEGKSLLIPVYDKDGEIQCLQAITPNKDADGRDKFYPAHGTMKGGRLNFGIALGRTIVCEGFATGASIHEATLDRVCVAFSLHGIQDIARELHAVGFPVCIAADRKGLDATIRFAAELGIPVFVPPAPHDDFNDLHHDSALEAVADVFNGPPVIAPTTPEPEPAQQPEGDAPDDLWNRPPPPKLPAGLLPPIIEQYAQTQGRMVGCDPAGIAMAALAACGAVIRDSIRVKVKRHEAWEESARLWVMLVGEPSTKKSPMMRMATGKIKSIDADMLRQYNRDIAAWKDRGETGDMPMPERLRIEDTTMEAAQEVCAHSPHGILAIQDELSGWFGGIEKYAGGKGGAKDRSFWLQAYGGGTYAVNRISRKSILIDNLSVSIVGGIQPDAIRRVMAGATDDGLIQRFFPVVLRPAHIGVDEELPNVAFEYDALIERLKDMTPPDSFLGEIPLLFDDDAMAIRADLERKHHGMVMAMESLNKKLSTHIGKYDGLFPRLCIIWHCIENANRPDLPSTITGDTARRVADFLHRFIMPHALAFYRDVVGLAQDDEVIRDIAGYILAHKVGQITYRTFQRGSTIMRRFTKEEVEPICQQLQAHGWVEQFEARNGKLRAEVNPQVHIMFAEQAEGERERRREVTKIIKDGREDEG